MCFRRNKKGKSKVSSRRIRLSDSGAEEQLFAFEQ